MESFLETLPPEEGQLIRDIMREVNKLFGAGGLTPKDISMLERAMEDLKRGEYTYLEKVQPLLLFRGCVARAAHRVSEVDRLTAQANHFQQLRRRKVAAADQDDKPFPGDIYMVGISFICAFYAVFLQDRHVTLFPPWFPVRSMTLWLSVTYTFYALIEYTIQENLNSKDALLFPYTIVLIELMYGFLVAIKDLLKIIGKLPLLNRLLPRKDPPTGKLLTDVVAGTLVVATEAARYSVSGKPWEVEAHLLAIALLIGSSVSGIIDPVFFDYDGPWGSRSLADRFIRQTVRSNKRLAYNQIQQNLLGTEFQTVLARFIQSSLPVYVAFLVNCLFQEHPLPPNTDGTPGQAFVLSWIPRELGAGLLFYLVAGYSYGSPIKAIARESILWFNRPRSVQGGNLLTSRARPTTLFPDNRGAPFALHYYLSSVIYYGLVTDKTTDVTVPQSIAILWAFLRSTDSNPTAAVWQHLAPSRLQAIPTSVFRDGIDEITSNRELRKMLQEIFGQLGEVGNRPFQYTDSTATVFWLKDIKDTARNPIVFGVDVLRRYFILALAEARRTGRTETEILSPFLAYLCTNHPNITQLPPQEKPHRMTQYLVWAKGRTPSGSGTPVQKHAENLLGESVLYTISTPSPTYTANLHLATSDWERATGLTDTLLRRFTNNTASPKDLTTILRQVGEDYICVPTLTSVDQAKDYTANDIDALYDLLAVRLICAIQRLLRAYSLANDNATFQRAFPYDDPVQLDDRRRRFEGTLVMLLVSYFGETYENSDTKQEAMMVLRAIRLGTDLDPAHFEHKWRSTATDDSDRMTRQKKRIVTEFLVVPGGGVVEPSALNMYFFPGE